MSEHSHTQDEPEIPFSPQEVRQFDEDDAEAGRAIGKMLSIMFLYTTIVMTISALMTYYWVTTNSLT